MAPKLVGDEAGVWVSGSVILNDFEIESILGEGAFGKVYLVRDINSGRHHAVKRAKLSDESKRRRAFLSELQTWVDLPDHPHLAACRFFRTVKDEIVIFAEYVDGGSLANAIRRRQVTRLDQMLDLAIQIAWGLGATHEHGLVHQDVKPANVLLTADGVAKVSDFGLARARADSYDATAETTNNILVSAGGMTPAYCSPEQARREPLTRRTDIWSFGLSVLEMFTGGVTWMNGVAAPAVLEDHLGQQSEEHGLPELPRLVADILRRCFEEDPANRWQSFSDLSDALLSAYPKIVNHRFERVQPKIQLARSTRAGGQRRINGRKWRDPAEWLSYVTAVSGSPPASVEESIARQPASEKAQAVADLRTFDELYRALSRVVMSGEFERQKAFARLCFHKALVHYAVDDLAEAVVLYDQALVLQERLVNQEGGGDLRGELAITYAYKANVARDLGDLLQAIILYDQALALLEPIVNQEGLRHQANDLANTYQNKAVALHSNGDLQAALHLCDQALSLRERLVQQEGRHELANELAGSYHTKAVVLHALGEPKNAAAWLHHAISIREKLIDQYCRDDVASDLARTYTDLSRTAIATGVPQSAVAICNLALMILNKAANRTGSRLELTSDTARINLNLACAFGKLGDSHRSSLFFERSLTAFERLVNQEGRRDLRGELAAAYAFKADKIRDLGDFHQAVGLYDQALALQERLVHKEARRDLRSELARSYTSKAIALRELGDLPRAVDLYDQALALLEPIVNQEGLRHQANDLANTYQNKAVALHSNGDLQAALHLCDQALSLRERLVQQEGRHELANELAGSYHTKAVVLHALGEIQAAAIWCNQAIAIREAFEKKDGRSKLLVDLADVRAFRAVLLSRQGGKQSWLAAVEARQLVSELRAELERTGGTNLKVVLHRVLDCLRDVLAQ